MMKQGFWTIVAIVVAGGALVGVLLLRSRPAPPVPAVWIGDTAVAVRVADTPEERERGLSGTEALREGEGMLFIFDEPGRQAFWMKDMRYAIDIIWLTSDWNVVAIAEQVAPESYPKTYVPSGPAQYVLEVPAGFAARHGIGIGQSATFRK